ncbi:MAG: 3-keto-5-aminohexanoate cleavage protein, partial [Alphaproteobacteria bacterium]
MSGAIRLSLPLLPEVMVAPTGARRTKLDHPTLPLTIEEIVLAAEACHLAGADGLHAHVRDGEGRHVLDAGLYGELIAEMSPRVPGMRVQITTESVDRYGPKEQRQVAREVAARCTRPLGISVALREMVREGDGEDTAGSRDFYHWAVESGVVVQHILYGAEELVRLRELIEGGVIPGEELALLFVLGKYGDDDSGGVHDLPPFLRGMEALSAEVEGAGRVEWSVCAFGRGEIACLREAWRNGGKCRIGFENSVLRSDGELAEDNA